MSSEATRVRVVQTGPVSQLLLESQDGLNLLSAATIQALMDAFQTLSQQSDLRVIILSGGDAKAFCAGADMHELLQLSDIPAYVALGQELTQLIEHYPVPVIAALNGYTLGAGFSLALACDLRVLSEKARIGQLAVRNGLIPPFGNLQQILRLAGPSRGRELILTGRVLSASEALHCELVHSVAPPEQLLKTAEELAAQICLSPARAIQWAKQLIVRTLEEGEAVGYALQEDALIACLGSPESRQIMQAFLDKP